MRWSDLQIVDSFLQKLAVLVVCHSFVCIHSSAKSTSFHTVRRLHTPHISKSNPLPHSICHCAQSSQPMCKQYDNQTLCPFHQCDATKYPQPSPLCRNDCTHSIKAKKSFDLEPISLHNTFCQTLPDFV